MRFFKLSTIVFLFSVALLFQSCKDEDPSKEQMLMASNGWILTAINVTPEYQGSSDLFPSYPECSQDNILKFKTHGYYDVDEGETKCNTSNPQTIESGTWTLDNTKTVLTLIASFGQYSAALGHITIETLTTTKLVFKVTQNSGGVTYTLNYVYVPK